MIVRARTVVTMDGPPIENGAIVTSDKHIAKVGTFDEIKKHCTGEIIDLGERILLPGLINAHCHLDYTMLRGKISRPKSFADWIRAINAEKENLSADDYVESINAGYSEARQFGTTTIANFTAFPELIARVRPLLRTWWFPELIDLRDPSQSEPLVDRALGSLQHTESWGLAPHAPFTASPNLFQRCEQIVRKADALISTHLAESNEEMQMSLDRRGSLHDFLLSLGVDLFESDGVTPVEHILRSAGALDDRWLLVHLNALLDRDLELLGAIPDKPQVIHCPRSHAYFGHPPFEFVKLRQSGFNICLATDSLASNADLSLFEEMRAFQRIHPEIEPREIMEMITVRPARALRAERSLGRIADNAYADLIAIDHTKHRDVFENILAHHGPVSWYMTNGTILAA
ncbi:MAG TPA: amidohydrolase family protein [Chthoniobacterales bacterium]|nr:amidohydrolase family protein [Chthoniobacterales bacterium]